jgi:membrane associated rhomboid family serine protease
MSSDPETTSAREKSSPWGEVSTGERPVAPQQERIFNAPLLVVVVAGSMLALYYMQSRQADDAALLYAYAFIPREMAGGAITGLFTHMLLHGSWAHAGMNAAGALAFGTPVARMMPGARGVFGFLTLYIVCGVIAATGYGLLHIESGAPLVGASGAVFGLIGAATRMMGGHGRLLPLLDRRVLTGAAAWVAVNVIIAFLAVVPGSEGGRIAWEAHIVGLIAGLLLVGPWLRLFGASRDRDRAGV